MDFESTAGYPDRGIRSSLLSVGGRSAGVVPGSGNSRNDLFGSMKVNKQLATSTTAVLYSCIRFVLGIASMVK